MAVSTSLFSNHTNVPEHKSNIHKRYFAMLWAQQNFLKQRFCLCCYLQKYYFAIVYNEKWVVWVPLVSCLNLLIFLSILEVLDGSPLNVYIGNNPLYHDVTVIAKKEIFWWAMYILHLPLLWPVPESGAPIKTLLMLTLLVYKRCVL